MSPDTDRIPAPTNGRGPHATEAPPVLEETPPVQSTAPFSPTQLAVGFGILASLLVLVVRRMRRRGRSGGRGFGRR